jgi:hypothetical protein
LPIVGSNSLALSSCCHVAGSSSVGVHSNDLLHYESGRSFSSEDKEMEVESPTPYGMKLSQRRIMWGVSKSLSSTDTRILALRVPRFGFGSEEDEIDIPMGGVPYM